MPDDKTGSQPTAKKPIRIETPRIATCSIVVDIGLFQDRHKHVIQIVENGVSRPLLSSVEGDSSDEWPPSPAFQQLHVEQRTDGDHFRNVALLVGMAGRNHWSMSVEAPSPAVMVFDVACRVDDRQPVNLRSTYQFTEVPSYLESGLCCWSLPNGWNVTLGVEESSAKLITGKQELYVLPTAVTGVTRRWRYSVAIQEQR